MRKLLTIALIFITSLGCAQPKSIKYYFQWLQAQDITNTRHFIWHGDTIDFNQMQLTDSILIAMTVDTLYIGNDTIYEGNFLLKRDSLSTWVTPKQLSDSLFSTIGHPPVTSGISAQTGGLNIDSTQVLVFQSANGSRNGYLLAVDWTNFNNKLSSVTHDESLDGLGTPASPLVVDTVSWVATKYDISFGNIDSVLMASKNWVKTYVYNWGVDTLGTDWTGTFDGQEGTYYLNYNNLSNKPTIPIIENDAYGVTWDDDLDGATKNVIYDAIQGVFGGVAHNALSLDPIKQNGLELNTGTQVLGLDTANVSTTGALSKHDYTKFYTRVLSNSKTGNSVTVNINDGTGTTFSVADVDSSATNEIQDLSYTAATRALGITGGTGVTMPLFSSSTTAAGLVPGGNNNGATYFLNATGNWTQPAGSTQWINDTYGIHYSTSNVGVGGDAVSGTKFNVNNTDQSYAGKFTSGETSYGVSIYAGSTSAHPALYVGRYNGYELFSVRGDGSLFANLYGAGNFSGTANYLLGVDASGNIVETELSGGGGTSPWTVSGSNIYPNNTSYNLFVGATSSALSTKFLSSTSTVNGWSGYFLGGSGSNGLRIKSGANSETYVPLNIQNNDGTNLFTVTGTGGIYMNTLPFDSTSYVLYYNNSTKKVMYGPKPAGSGGDNWGTQYVINNADSLLKGRGTTASPLSIDTTKIATQSDLLWKLDTEVRLADSTQKVTLGDRDIIMNTGEGAGVYSVLNIGTSTEERGIQVVNSVDYGSGIMSLVSGLWGKGVTSYSDGVNGFGGEFSATSNTGVTYGISAGSFSPDGYAGYFINQANTGNSYGIYSTTSSSSGYAGYFNGQVASSSTFTGTNFILNSDYRYKYGIRDAENLYWVDRLDFKTFRMIDDPKARKRFGLVAQDVEKIMPDFVYTDEKGYKSLGYTDILIAVVARQKQQILDLQERVERLEMLINEKYAK